MSDNKNKKIVILTGAGISAESGIKTFRDQNGLWEDHNILEVASPQGFERDPELVHRFYNLRRKQLLSSEVAPNKAHLAVARLQKELPNSEVFLITQNVDNLHERAGSSQVLHMHGELTKMRCIESKKVFEIKEDISPRRACPCCLKEGNLRPHIVWFGETPFFMDEIYHHTAQCDLFIAIGTSGVVYPAAMLVDLARENGAQTLEFNLSDTQVSDSFHKHIVGPASQTVSKYVEELLNTTPHIT